MASNYLATILNFVKPDATRGTFTTVNGILAAGSVLGTNVSVTTTALTIHSQAPTIAGALHLRSQETDFPISQYAAASTNPAGVPKDNQWSIQLNEGGVSAMHPEWGENIENYYDSGTQKLLEKNWTYTSVNGLVTYRPFGFFVDVDTNHAGVRWLIEDYRISSRNALAGGRPEFQWVINTDAIYSTHYGPLGIGADPRSGLNGPQLRVTGSAGTGLEFVTLNPTALATTGSVIYAEIPTVAEATGLSVQGNCSAVLNNILRNTHVTGIIRDTLWAVGGDVVHRYLNSGGDFAAGVTAAGDYKLAASYDLSTSTAISVNKTTLAATFFGGIISTPPANTRGVSVTGYSCTGTDSDFILNLAGTWNTTGAPTFLHANVTDTASHADSLLMNLRVGGVSKFSVGKAGVITATTFVGALTGTASGNLVISAPVATSTYRLNSEIINTPTGITQTIDLGAKNHQTLLLTSATGTVTVTLTVPSSSSGGTIIAKQHATAAKDLTWTVSSGSIVWLGTEPDWGADAVSKIRIVSWRYDGTVTYLAATNTN